MTLHDIKQFVGTWLRTSNDIHRLQALDNRLLGDMGIDRTDIRRRVGHGIPFTWLV